MMGASSAAFVLGLLGLDGGAVYDVSMLEWATDPSLPLVTGRLSVATDGRPADRVY